MPDHHTPDPHSPGAARPGSEEPGPRTQRALDRLDAMDPGDHGRFTPPLAPPARTLDLRQVTIVGVVALGLFTLMNASSLLRIVERQPFGWQRSVQVALVKPIDGLSHLLFLDRPRTTADDALGHEFGDAEAFDDLTTAEPPAAPPATELPEPTAADPLEIVVVGDSQAEILGQSVIDKAAATGVMDATLDFEFSSGLTRPDFFNWPAEIQQVVETTDPDAMVVVFGANDGQGMELDTGVFQPGDPEWNAEYARRVDAVMTYLEQQGVRVYWIGQPIARDGEYSARLQLMNGIFEEVAADHPNTTIVSLYDLFADENGNYSDYLPGAGGEVVNMRNSDGIHMTRAGGDRAADAIFAAIEEDLPNGAPTPTTVAPAVTPTTIAP
ncbi:MAG: DUF459 domain-containing protein [Acidimicrobiales bacterium]|nr:DUF459 domain-containing protein [Acidimicrobiales bacterium]